MAEATNNNKSEAKIRNVINKIVSTVKLGDIGSNEHQQKIDDAVEAVFTEIQKYPEDIENILLELKDAIFDETERIVNTAWFERKDMNKRTETDDRLVFLNDAYTAILENVIRKMAGKESASGRFLTIGAQIRNDYSQLLRGGGRTYRINQ